MATVDEALAELAAVPPREFVKARGALAGRLRKEGAAAAARAVAAAKRPPVALWAVNRLAHHAKDSLDGLIDATDRVKAAQLGRGGSAGALAPAMAQQRARLGDLMRRAEDALREAGVRSSAELLRRIETTLVAATSDKESRAALRRGRLEHELAPLGFDVFGGAAARPQREEPATPSPAPGHQRQRTRESAEGRASKREDRGGTHLGERRDATAARRGERENAAAARRREREDAAAARRRQRDEAARERQRAREEAAREAEQQRARARAEIEARASDLSAARDRVRRAREELKGAAEAVRDATRAERIARRALADARKPAGARGGRR